MADFFSGDPLARFHPLVAAWFRERLGEPTEPQRLAWPQIAAGKHVLVTAPTGSGKTLTAFLWAIDRLLSGAWPGGKTRVLYLSPLKALNADVERNLLSPLRELATRFEAAGLHPPAVRVATRSGDTPANERQRLLRQPPEILITTPESLNILLTTKAGRTLFDGLTTVILDEIHAVAGTKRGTHLITAVERLTLNAGEFQRVALSATVQPLDTVAAFVGGFEREGEGEATRYRPRPVQVVRAAVSKRYDVAVRFSGKAAETPEGPSNWDQITPQVLEIIRRHRSTLVFTNSRRMTERVTRLLNDAAGSDLVYSHHGSLSKEVRQVVEGRLQRGELPALVATSSLELGIDVGHLDEVVLVQTPKTVSSAVQRIGRAGHRVGEVSRGSIFPTFGRDFLEAAVTARAILEQDIEPIQPVANALDVLAQVILSMAVVEIWNVDELYRFLRSTYPYRTLSRKVYDLTLDMLAGRYADTRVRELKPRLAFDRVEGTVRAKPGVDRLLYLSGGTIPDRGYFHLRLEGSMAQLGELDEEFVWERSVGDTFVLGASAWRIRQITHNDVLVTPAHGGAAMAPFWRADERDRDAHLSLKVAAFLELAEARLEEDSFRQLLLTDYCMEPGAATELLALLSQQRAATEGLPHRHRLVAEWVGDRGADGRRQLILHTLWGGKVNRPFSLALAGAWEARYPTAPLEVTHDDNALLLVVPHEATLEELLALVPPDAIESLLRRRLEATGFFGARFRENAGRALLLPKSGFRQRTPLWLHRQRAKKLLEAVSRYGDFPLVAETWRTCLEDEFELPALKSRLAELESGAVVVHEVSTLSASPLAAGLVWKQTNTAMYDDDTPLAPRGGLKPDLLRELVFSSGLRPKLGGAALAAFEAKLQRLHPGYAPRSAAEVIEWVKERVILPFEEWQGLITAVTRDRGEEGAIATHELAHRLVRVTLPGAEPDQVVALETLPRLAAALDIERQALKISPLSGVGEIAAETLVAVDTLWARDAARDRSSENEMAELEPLPRLFADWARFYGPFAQAGIERRFGLTTAALTLALETLADTQLWIVDRLREGAEELEICDTENLETLLRFQRAAARPVFSALPASKLPLFLAAHQGLLQPGAGLDELKARLEPLLGFPAPAASWESDFLPARLSPYYPSWLDTLFGESDLGWLGVGAERLTLGFPGDRDLLGDFGSEADAPSLAGFEQPMELAELQARTGLSSAEITERLWQLAWRGGATHEGFAVVRRGIQHRFQAVEAGGERASAAAGARFGRARGGRSHQGRWQASRPFGGRWTPLPPVALPADALESDELAQQRVRLLLDRYGVLFRELLFRELPAFQWGGLFRALRRMELAGEVLAGHFFSGPLGPQFISPAAFRRLKEGLPEDPVWWVNALDPASPAGLDLEETRSLYPRRHATTYLAFQGSRLVVTARRGGKDLNLAVPPDHPQLPDYLVFLKALLSREFEPERSIEIETINGEPASKSPYLEVLAGRFGMTRDPGTVRLFKKYP